jgi:hypothetical protein
MQEYKNVIVTEVLPPKEVKGPKDTYTISRFVIERMIEKKNRKIVFSAFKDVAEMVDRLKQGDRVNVKWYAESIIYKDGNHHSVVKATWVEKVKPFKNLYE